MSEIIQSLVENINAFALDLYSRLSTAEDNLCLSPFCISTALAMTFAGARGVTENQMKKVMHISLAQPEFHKGFAQLLKQISATGEYEDIELFLANSIYPHHRYHFLESFKACLKEYYATTLTPVDYNEPETARQLINHWVSEKTQEHIFELIPANALDVLTRLVLVNAIYFKGLWANQFDKQATIQQPFWISPDCAVRVPMMCQQSEFNYAEDELVQVLELPYQGNQLSLLVILPKDRLSTVEGNLNSQLLSKWLASLRFETIDIRLPLFKINSQYELTETLSAMGMPDAFDDSRADFSSMDGTHELVIRNVFHQATLEVSEEGTTATAATAVVMAIKGLPRVFQFHVTHPFIFLLRENATGSILFIGKIVNPL